MSNIIWKQFNLCFSHFKCFPTSLPTPSSPPHHPSPSCDLFSSSSGDSSDATTDSHPPDLTSVFASNRFFFSSPGQSNSIIDSPGLLSATTATGVAVETDSPDPYLDFRRSMQEMVEARDYTDVEKDWDFLHELLLCYLILNPKHTHKFIVGAFSDLLVSLMASSGRRKVDGSLRTGTTLEPDMV